MTAAWVVTLALAASSTAYVRSRVETSIPGDPAAHCLWWKAGPIPFAQNQLGNPDAPGEASFSAVSAGYGAWGAEATACGNFTLEEKGRTARKDVGFDPAASDNLNLALFRSQSCKDKVPSGDGCWSDGECNNRYDCWQYTAATIGLTTTTYDRKTGQIYDADLELNAANFKMTTADAPPCAAGLLSNCVSSDVQNTVTHEVGHMLGLDHAPDPQSTMYASAPIGETSKRTLDDGSRAFVCEVYPAGSESRDCVLTPVDEALGTRASCSAAEGAAAWPWLLLGALGAAAARRRGGR